MNNKKIITILMSALMLMPTAVYAKGNPHNTSDNGRPTLSQSSASDSVKNKNEDADEPASISNDNAQSKGMAQKQANAEKKDDKKQEIETFKTQMKAKHEEMKQLRQQTIAVKQEVESKKAQLTSIINDIEAGKKTLPQDMLDALLSKSQELKADSDSIKATSEVSKEVTDTQDKVNKKDFNNALSSLDKVIGKLQARLDALKQLDTDLDGLLAIANQAAAPADSTAPAQDQTSSSGTTGDAAATSNSNETTVSSGN